MEETLEQAVLALGILKDELNKIDLTKLKVDEKLSTSNKVKAYDSLLEEMNNINSQLSTVYSNFYDIMFNQLISKFSEQLAKSRKELLMEEIDTPREVYDILVRYMNTFQTTDELEAIKNYFEKQLPPTKEVIKEIPFDVAKIEDASLSGDEEIVEVEGVAGQVKIIYEINDDAETELSREVILRPATKVVRVAPVQ